jgi:hypothetical protein
MPHTWPLVSIDPKNSSAQVWPGRGLAPVHALCKSAVFGTIDVMWPVISPLNERSCVQVAATGGGEGLTLTVGLL